MTPHAIFPFFDFQHLSRHKYYNFGYAAHWAIRFSNPSRGKRFSSDFFFLTGYAAHRAIRCSNASRGKRFASEIFFWPAMRPIGRSGVRIPAGVRDFLPQFFSDRLCGPSGDPVFESQEGQEISFWNFFSERLCGPPSLVFNLFQGSFSRVTAGA